jgi:hypothetical protein
VSNSAGMGKQNKNHLAVVFDSGFLFLA